MKKKKPQKPNKAQPKPFKERRVYIFKCSGCGKKKAQSFRRKKARKLLCRKCRRHQVHEDQQSLFSPPADSGGGVGVVGRVEFGFPEASAANQQNV